MYPFDICFELLLLVGNIISSMVRFLVQYEEALLKLLPSGFMSRCTCNIQFLLNYEKLSCSLQNIASGVQIKISKPVLQFIGRPPFH